MLMMRSFMICTLLVGTACQETSNVCDVCIGASKAVWFTDRIVGCDAAWSSPGVASASAVCGSAAHICTSLEEIREGGLADGACALLLALLASSSSSFALSVSARSASKSSRVASSSAAC